MENTGTIIIETNRLLLRPFINEDYENMFYNWANDSEVTKYLSWKAHKSTLETKALVEMWVKEYANLNFYQWVIELKDTKEIIGTISIVKENNKVFEKELGYCIGKKYWNNGYVTEAGLAVLDHLFNTINCNRIVASFNIANPASGKVMQKLGMTYEGTLRQSDLNNDGELIDMVQYAILKEEFNK